MSTQVNKIEKTPLVTVLMGVYNGERYLREAFESILKQTFTDFEFIIVDDGSTDASRTIILSYGDPRIRLIENPVNMGLTKSLNRGLSLARGEYIARQDADDISLPTRLEKQVAFMMTHPEVALLGTQAQLMTVDGSKLRINYMRKATSLPGIMWQMMTFSAFVHTSVMFKKKIIWQQMKGYNESYVKRQDYELWSRVVAQQAVANLEEVLVRSRVHSKSVSWNYKVEDLHSYLNVLHLNIRNCFPNQSASNQWSELVLWLNDRRSPPPSFPYREVTHVLQSMCTTYLRTKLYVQPCKKELYSIFAWDFTRAAIRLASVDRWISLRAYYSAFYYDKRIAIAAIPIFLLSLVKKRIKWILDQYKNKVFQSEGR